MKTMFREPPQEIKEAKMAEIRCMTKPNWQVQLEVCESVEKVVVELIQMFDASMPKPSQEEKSFVRGLALVIEDRLERKFTVEDIV
jgi:hypothetical protein